MAFNDRDGNRSNPYKPNPQQCCEACVFGRGEHAEWCSQYVCPHCTVPWSQIYDCSSPNCDCECHETEPDLTPQGLAEALQAFAAMKTVRNSSPVCEFCGLSMPEEMLAGHLWFVHGVILECRA